MTLAPAGGRDAARLDRLDPLAPDDDELVAADLSLVHVHQASGPDGDHLGRRSGLRGSARAEAEDGGGQEEPSLTRLMGDSRRFVSNGVRGGVGRAPNIPTERGSPRATDAVAVAPVGRLTDPAPARSESPRRPSGRSTSFFSLFTSTSGTLIVSFTEPVSTLGVSTVSVSVPMTGFST